MDGDTPIVSEQRRGRARRELRRGRGVGGRAGAAGRAGVPACNAALEGDVPTDSDAVADAVSEGDAVP